MQTYTILTPASYSLLHLMFVKHPTQVHYRSQSQREREKEIRKVPSLIKLKILFIKFKILRGKKFKQ